MINKLSLRFRIFLFFCLIAVGGISVTLLALYLGYHRAGIPDLLDAFVFSGALICFTILGLTAGIWLLFDENVAKPIDQLAAAMRVRAHAGVSTELDQQPSRYLGDLGPAAADLADQLSDTALSTAAAIARETARLKTDRDRLTAVLSDMPVAMVVANPTHQIVLYDGQAAEVLAQVAPPRLNASLLDYLDSTAFKAAYAQLITTGMEVSATCPSANGQLRIDLRLKPLGNAPGYLLVFDDAHANYSADAARPLVYNFNLLDKQDNVSLEDQTLSNLCFVVFDTETTGLLPHKDEVVQIGAVRVLHGRIVETERIDTLVDPGCIIPTTSTRVHGITDAMVQGAPDIHQAGQNLHHFATDAVLVAHNAPFDLAFLRRHSKPMGLAWDHPVLDTVLLSAVLFGASESHTLDALCTRLDVSIPSAFRHTALGDAQATAEVLCKMLPMLQARGIKTFGDVLTETRQHGRLLEDLN